MVETTSGQRNMTIDLHIKQLSIKVSEQMPVYVQWQRGNKKAKTKSKQFDPSVTQAIFDDKFQISTMMDVDENGQPTKAKMSKLTVTGDKGKGVLGEAELNLSEYQEQEFRYMKLQLKGCSDPDAFIEVGLKATPAREKKTAQETPRSSSFKDTEASKEQMIQVLDDLDKEKKLQKKQKQEYEEKIRGLNEKINNLQTTLENTKTDLTFLQKQQKGLSQEKEVMSKDIDILKLKVQQKEDAVHEKEKDIKEHNGKLKAVQIIYEKVYSEIEAQRNTKDQEVKDLQVKIDQAQIDFKKLCDFDRFDTDYLSSIAKLTSGRANYQNQNYNNNAAPSGNVGGYSGGMNRRQNDRY
eukprot:403353063